MKTKDLQRGQWYWIKYTDKKETFAGKGMFKMANPPNYAQNTLEFLCEDGLVGVFEIENIKEVCLPPNNLNEILLKVSG